VQPSFAREDAGASQARPFAGAERWLATAVTPKFIWSSLLAVWSCHAVVWIVATQARRVPFEQMLRNYDAGWYWFIAQGGYAKPTAWAFYPLWPLLVHVCSPARGATTTFVQLSLAVALFAASVALYFTRPERHPLLAPKTRLGWLFFVLAPAAYVFHSGHTESLFLFLSLSAFALAARGRWLLAACVAGLCALTRNQGVFVALAIALWSAQDVAGSRRVARFAAAGLIGAGLFALYPLYQYLSAGDPFLFLHAQSAWAHATSLGDVLQTLVLGNAVKPWEYATRVHHPWFVGALVGSAWFYREQKQLPLTVYFVLSALVMLAQGNVSNFFRFSVVLAPLVFYIGDRIAKTRFLWQALLLLPALIFHSELTFNYAIRRWPY
jgi:hypothetical protein